MKAYKGFNRDMTCRGYQYEEGKTYETDEAKLCHSGFHACEMPLDIFNYYSPASSEYHEVELDGISDERHRADTKVCGTKIKIGARLSIRNLVDAQIEYIKERAHEVEGGHTDKDHGAASAAGNTGVASAAGDWGAASATGRDGVAMACGYDGRAMAALGNVICLVERGPWNNDDTRPILAAKAAIVDGEHIKANTWYHLVNGEFKEVKE